jgi:uncharacterized protein
MFVELARYFAQEGIHSLRFDCSGRGDSLGPVRALEESRFDIVSVVQSLLRQNPDQHIALLGFGDSGMASILSLPLLKADQRKILATVLINPWTDPIDFEAKAKLSDYYVQRLKSKEFWGKLLSGRVQVASAIGEVLQSSKEASLASAPNENHLRARLLQAIEAADTTLLAVLATNDPMAQLFSTWRDNEITLRSKISEANILRDSGADHTFSNESDWLEVCRWISQRLNLLKTAT